MQTVRDNAVQNTAPRQKRLAGQARQEGRDRMAESQSCTEAKKKETP